MMGGALTYLLGVLLATGSQLLLKTSALTPHESRLREYLNLRVIAAYGLLLLSTALTVLALRTLTVSLAAVLGATEYVFVTAASALCFKEKPTKRTLLGIALIIAGVLLTCL